MKNLIDMGDKVQQSSAECQCPRACMLCGLHPFTKDFSLGLLDKCYVTIQSCKRNFVQMSLLIGTGPPQTLFTERLPSNAAKLALSLPM